MENILLLLLLSPIVTATWLNIKNRQIISHKAWHFYTASLLAYLWVWLMIVFLIVPMHFLVALYLPYPISLIDQPPYSYWFSIPLFIVFSELHLTAAACLASSWWLVKYLQIEWHMTFLKEEKNG